MRRRPTLRFALAVLPCLCLARVNLAADREVSFQTEDGWTIHASLSVPARNSQKVPAVILLPSPENDRTAFEKTARDLLNSLTGVATLSIDPRGRGNSIQHKGGPSSRADVSKSFLDVRAAIAFLVTQPGIDSLRLGIIAEGMNAQAAIHGSRGDSRVGAIALISGRLDETAKELIAASEHLSLLAVVSAEDKRGFADMTDAYFRSKDSQSDIRVLNDLGSGTAMLSAFQKQYPSDKPLGQAIGDWVTRQLLGLGNLTEVSFQTEDGWTIYANFRVPQLSDRKVPAVILLHSGLSDRYAYHDLEIALAQAGLAVLNIDWRGKGKSTGKGKYFELSKAERDKGYLDAMAAVKFLASQAMVDVNRTGIVGTVIGAKYAMAAAAEDPKIKTAVVLTGYIPTEKEKAYFTSHDSPVLYVTSRGHNAVTQALFAMYQQTKNRGSEIVIYDGGAIGYQLFELDEKLLPRVVLWMREHL